MQQELSRQMDARMHADLQFTLLQEAMTAPCGTTPLPQQLLQERQQLQATHTQLATRLQALEAQLHEQHAAFDSELDVLAQRLAGQPPLEVTGQSSGAGGAGSAGGLALGAGLVRLRQLQLLCSGEAVRHQQQAGDMDAESQPPGAEAVTSRASDWVRAADLVCI